MAAMPAAPAPRKLVTDLSHAREIGARIRQLRRKRDLSAAELAVKTGISVDHLLTLERGEHRAFTETLRRLAAGLGVSLARLTDRA